MGNDETVEVRDSGNWKNEAVVAVSVWLKTVAVPLLAICEVDN